MKVINNHKLVYIRFLRFLTLSLLLSACPAIGQVDKKKDLVPLDYAKWHRMIKPKISDQGKWATFVLSYENSMDTLVLQNLKNNERILIPYASNEHFLQDKWLLYQTNNNLNIYDLEKKTTHIISNIKDYQTTPNAEYIVARVDNSPVNEEGEKELQIYKIGEDKVISIMNVEEYQLNLKGDLLAYVTLEQKRTLQFLCLESPYRSTKLFENIESPLERIVWSSKDDLAFLEITTDDENKKVLWVRDIKVKANIQSFVIAARDDIEAFYKILVNPSTYLKFSGDGQKLFFHLQRKSQNSVNDSNASQVRIWNAKDKLINPVYHGNEEFYKNPPLLGCWNLEIDIFHLLGDIKSSKSILIENSRYVFTHSLIEDFIAHDNSLETYPIYVFNIDSGEKKFVMFREPKMPIKVDPSGRYLVYFNLKNWYIYDAQKDTFSNLTGQLPFAFIDEEYDWSGPIPPYGIAGVSDKDNFLLIYDKYDIWSIPINGEKANRITNGREHQIIYRAVSIPESNTNSNGYTLSLFPSKNDITLYAEKPNGTTGYSKIAKNGTICSISHEVGRVNQLQKAKHKNNYLYTIERFDMSPKLMLAGFPENLTREIYQSNPQQSLYNWGDSKLINYKTSKGDVLKAALFYPADYNPKDYYPMITFIYEKMSSKLHKYENPSLWNGADINITNFTLKGYFVFCPDIAYDFNNPGKSALISVEAGVAEVLKSVPIDKNRIGLFGHSFGGFETSYIIGNTDIFSAAISASGFHNLKSFYLSVAWLWDMPQSGRFLNSQPRFTKPYFEIPEYYEMNSPINYAPTINTPLLTTTGDKDTNVNWEQSVEMYNALRVLKKEHILLVYPDEGHDIQDPKNQIDITYKRWQWFDHYLKDTEAAPWMLQAH